MKVDLLLINCKLVNVLSGEILDGARIAVQGERIVGLGADFSSDHVIDLKGDYVYPAFVDAHIHLESTKLTVVEAARVMAKCGTGSVVTDPHEIANVSGMDGIRFQMACAQCNPFMHVFFTAPSCVPALKDRAIETYGNELDASALRELLDEPDVVALGEMMNVPGVIFGDRDVLEKIASYRQGGRVIDGHAPMLSGEMLCKCISAGISSDHESTNADEALEKVRLGMHVMIREGSSERNLDALLPLVNEWNALQFSFASDDLDPSDLMQRGHINHLVRRAVEAGMPAMLAIQLATINPARHFGMDSHIGAIAPGRFADLIVSHDLVSFEPHTVMHRGAFVIQDGVECISMNVKLPELAPAMHVRLPDVSQLAIAAVDGHKAHALSVVSGQILTRDHLFEPIVRDGVAYPDAAQDTAKVCVFERHHETGAFGVAFVHGFGLQRGAMGSSVGHDSHNIVVVGMNDADMLRCAEMIRDANGGQAAVLGDASVVLPLPIAGLMSDQSASDVVLAEKQIDAFCAEKLGVTLPRPMAALSFMSLPVIPTLRITDQGLFYVAPGAYPRKIEIFE